MTRADRDATHNAGEFMKDRQQDQQREMQAGTDPEPRAKRRFVEPAIAQPVDVLEATTFLQVVESGGTGFRKKGGRPSSKPVSH
jgi:hypothetical protein